MPFQGHKNTYTENGDKHVLPADSRTKKKQRQKAKQSNIKPKSMELWWTSEITDPVQVTVQAVCGTLVDE